MLLWRAYFVQKVNNLTMIGPTLNSLIKLGDFLGLLSLVLRK